VAARIVEEAQSSLGKEWCALGSCPLRIGQTDSRSTGLLTRIGQLMPEELKTVCSVNAQVEFASINPLISAHVSAKGAIDNRSPQIPEDVFGRRGDLMQLKNHRWRSNARERMSPRLSACCCFRPSSVTSSQCRSLDDFRYAGIVLRQNLAEPKKKTGSVRNSDTACWINE
jgi:hypothetical protein